MTTQPGRAHDDESGTQTDAALLDRAIRLFDFLSSVQQITNTPVHHIDTYRQKSGEVVWLNDLPDHWAVEIQPRNETGGSEQPLLVLDRVPRHGPPTADEALKPWIDGSIDDIETPPRLRSSILLTAGEHPGEEELPRPSQVIRLEDHPDVERLFASWIHDWRVWAEDERQARPVRDLYDTLFRAHLTRLNAPEEWEAILGIGALSWIPEKHEPVLRHCLTHPVEFHLDDDTGRISVLPAESGQFAVELSMLEAQLWPEESRIREVKELAAEYSGHLLDRAGLGNIARRLTHQLDAAAEFRDVDVPPEPASAPICHFAPALILRRRSRQGLIEIFQTIRAQLTDAGTVPEGLKILLDPDLASGSSEVFDPATGAWIEDDDDIFLPLPVNDRQLEVIRRVDNRAMTLVQGPPGTGKTHTAAALISHLLAQGKRVLVTAQTDQALKEVRAKLPDSLRDLSVSVVGSGRAEMAELRVAVNRLSEMAAEHSEAEAESEANRALRAIDELKRQKAKIAHELLEARESETLRFSHGGYEGTLADIAEKHLLEKKTFGWLAETTYVAAESKAPMSNAEALAFVGLLRDQDIQADSEECRQYRPDIDQLPHPDTFCAQVEEVQNGAGQLALHAPARGHEAIGPVAALSPSLRTTLRQGVVDLVVRSDELVQRNPGWPTQALDDVRSGRADLWRSRYETITTALEQVRPIVVDLGPLVDVAVTAPNAKSLVPHATSIRDRLAAGKTLPIDSRTREPKQSLFTPGVVKAARPLFEQVRVDGVAPTTIAALDTFLAWVEATSIIAMLDEVWRDLATPPSARPLIERLTWHEMELHALRQVLDVAEAQREEDDRLTENGIPSPDWSDPTDVQRLLETFDAIDAEERYAAAQRPLDGLREHLASAARRPGGSPVIAKLKRAAEQQDCPLYREAYARLERLNEVGERIERLDTLMEKLSKGSAALAREVSKMADRNIWDDRLARFEEAWRWAATASWIEHRRNMDPNALQASYTAIEDKVRAELTNLATTRAWSKAVHRLGNSQRADLTQYAQLVQAYGKTGGKYAAQKNREIRETMRRCRPSVPVWIMPIYRISQSLTIDADLFDVIIVDEASQAGLEATFLQYLAPKIVVIGDDKQNSPRAVGVNELQLQQLADQYLAGDRYIASWKNPRRSLFDEARMRFGDIITLIEHRRSVPEIIGFSNRIAYEPDGIRLVPVRQVGHDALSPIKRVFVGDGYAEGSRTKINPPEADAIVDQIVKCLDDPAYDGLTFGVISLTGSAQAKRIEKMLMDRVNPSVWQARELRCGTAPDFQGSERNVIFLSMVAALADDQRYAPLTRETYLQQFNVAASRAKDQMWLFHSIQPTELTNHEDLRYQLLDYCYGVERRSTSNVDRGSASPVPEDRLTPPFDSLFEQRVHNRIFDRGYTVIPQFAAGPYSIDLVVVGAKGRLAVECDGDHWHGPERYQADMARQRELQRCGWQFFRVRESEFIINPTAALAPLWGLLEKLDDFESATEPEFGSWAKL